MTNTNQHPDQSSAPVPPDFRALCAELAELSAPTDSIQQLCERHTKLRELAIRARAALAQPVPPRPTDEDLIQTASDAGLCYPVCWDLPENQMQMQYLRNFARAVLARWGNTTPQPVPVSERPDTRRLRYLMHNGPDGFAHVERDRYEYAMERAEMAGRDEPNEDDELNGFRLMIDAAIANDTPQPVPVSERMPGPEDCDAEGYCWWFDTDSWIRISPNSGFAWGKITHWLPAHALPTPGDNQQGDCDHAV